MHKIKQYIDYDVDMNVRIHDILSELRFDKNKDIQEAVEHLDLALLQQRKKTKDEEKSIQRQEVEKNEL